MRIQIKTKHPIRDPDVRGLYIIEFALRRLTDRMKVATLEFFADRLGFKLVQK